jgi:hypothetical protein
MSEAIPWIFKKMSMEETKRRGKEWASQAHKEASKVFLEGTTLDESSLIDPDGPIPFYAIGRPEFLRP